MTCQYCGDDRVHFQPGAYCVDVLKKQIRTLEAQLDSVRGTLMGEYKHVERLEKRVTELEYELEKYDPNNPVLIIS